MITMIQQSGHSIGKLTLLPWQCGLPDQSILTGCLGTAGCDRTCPANIEVRHHPQVVGRETCRPVPAERVPEDVLSLRIGRVSVAGTAGLPSFAAVRWHWQAAQALIALVSTFVVHATVVPFLAPAGPWRQQHKARHRTCGASWECR